MNEIQNKSSPDICYAALKTGNVVVISLIFFNFFFLFVAGSAFPRGLIRFFFFSFK